MLISFFQKNLFFRKLIYKFGEARARDMINQIKDFLGPNKHLIDIGSGNCNVSEQLTQAGYKVTSLDVQNLSFVDNLTPHIYDGKTIPFANDTFDIALILTVLHHTPDPEKIIEEAKRVAPKIIIIEDVYSNIIHKYLTYFFDSLMNLEFGGHPHTNKNDKQWRQIFKKHGLNLIETKTNSSFLVFKHATYYLERAK